MLERAAGRFATQPSITLCEHDLASPLGEAGPFDAVVGWVRDAGFGEVDCHFKWLELALVVAVKDR